jgi:thiamine-phosphate pyrophosphorylase
LRRYSSFVPGCDGVHIGVEDMSLREAQRIMRPDAIGVTCKTSRHRAMEAAEQGASYVAFGAFFDSATRGVIAEADPEILEWWSQLMEVPCVAIGGITPENCGPLVKAGADFICASAGVWQHPDGPAAGVKAYNEAIRRLGRFRARTAIGVAVFEPTKSSSRDSDHPPSPAST